MMKKIVRILFLIVMVSYRTSFIHANTPEVEVDISSAFVEKAPVDAIDPLFDSEANFDDLKELDGIDLETIEEHAKDPTFLEQIKLGLLYMKIRSKEEGRKVLDHVTLYKTYYISGTVASLTLIAALFLIKYYLQKNQDPNIP